MGRVMGLSNTDPTLSPSQTKLCIQLPILLKYFIVLIFNMLKTEFNILLLYSHLFLSPVFSIQAAQERNNVINHNASLSQNELSHSINHQIWQFIQDPFTFLYIQCSNMDKSLLSLAWSIVIASCFSSCPLESFPPHHLIQPPYYSK